MWMAFDFAPNRGGGFTGFVNCCAESRGMRRIVGFMRQFIRDIAKKDHAKIVLFIITL